MSTQQVEKTRRSILISLKNTSTENYHDDWFLKSHHLYFVVRLMCQDCFNEITFYEQLQKQKLIFVKLQRKQRMFFKGKIKNYSHREKKFYIWLIFTRSFHYVNHLQLKFSLSMLTRKVCLNICSLRASSSNFLGKGKERFPPSSFSSSPQKLKEPACRLSALFGNKI